MIYNEYIIYFKYIATFQCTAIKQERVGKLSPYTITYYRVFYSILFITFIR